MNGTARGPEEECWKSGLEFDRTKFISQLQNLSEGTNFTETLFLHLCDGANITVLRGLLGEKYNMHELLAHFPPL